MTEKLDAQTKIELLKISLELTEKALERHAYAFDNIETETGNRIYPEKPDFSIGNLFNECHIAVLEAFADER